MAGDERVHLIGKREAAHPHQVERDALFGQHLVGFQHRRAGGAEIDRAQLRRLLRPAARTGAGTSVRAVWCFFSSRSMFSW